MPEFETPRRVSGFTATCVLVSNVIGSGIFTTTGFMARDLGETWLILLLWFVGGLLSLAGAVCYSELGAALPLAGGEYVYLRHAYGSFVGFLSGWASFTVGFGAAVAAGAVSFSSYLGQIVPIHDGQAFTLKGFALGLVWLLTIVHMTGVGPGSLVQQILTVLKVGAILGLIIGALTIGQGSWEHFTLTKTQPLPQWGTVVVSFIFVTYAYSGWNAAGYIAGEIIDPSRNIPRTMIGGTVAVGLLYAGLNMIYLYALPMDVLAAPPILPVAQKAAMAMFGPAAAYAITILLCISIAGAMSAMIWAGPRVYYAMAKDGVIPAYFSKTQHDRLVPGRAILLQSLWITVLIVTGTFEQLVVYSGVVLALFTGLAIGAVMVLRWKHPHLPRPYRVSFYPVLPILYIMASVMIVVYSITERPEESLWAMGTVLTGVPLYFLWRRPFPKAQTS